MERERGSAAVGCEIDGVVAIAAARAGGMAVSVRSRAAAVWELSIEVESNHVVQAADAA